MQKNKKVKCFFCGATYISKKALYNHMASVHPDELKLDDGTELTPAHLFFDLNNHNTRHKGRCVICGRDTEFNENTSKYERFDRQVCREKYREQFVARMQKTYGKSTLLNDPDHQKKMLESRRISGEYTWSDGKSKSKYVGTYEKDLLRHLDKDLGLKPTDVLSPAPQVFDYTYNDKNHFYIPDVYIIPFNLFLEVKGSNKHYRDRDIEKEKAKDRMMELNKKVRYLKVLDKKYDKLDNYIAGIMS